MSDEIKIIEYNPKYNPNFKAINEAWITTYFKLEGPDFELLDHPKEAIIDKGGSILFAQLGGEVVGTCALIKVGEGIFELGKMGVMESARGKKVGKYLGLAILKKAEEMGAKKIVLISNSGLTPALKLYESLGFKHVKDFKSEYERGDVMMERWLGE
ncbi:GNAT family N-acetyltransferase [Flexithrix dorotheae]|uniref:GNAT family N-acetyltransferase n=1 Tax=Flexithrix dorotheae TaxID=70993 RepID=UPI0003789D4A|nr:GNAT family N-acetyltransferase [Flexithrix dorotheae]